MRDPAKTTPERNPPRPLPVLADSIPQKLRDRRQWLVWAYIFRKGTWSKIPFDAKTGRFGKSNDPATWCDFETAVTAYRSGRFHGIGFAFAAGDGLCGVDIDHVIDKDTGIVEPWAQEIVGWFRGCGYVERSPSGEGIRIFCEGRPLRTGKGTVEKRIELYDHTSPRYLTVTGQPFMTTGNSVESSTETAIVATGNSVGPSTETAIVATGNSVGPSTETAMVATGNSVGPSTETAMVATGNSVGPSMEPMGNSMERSHG